jgi:hypothetical protein
MALMALMAKARAAATAPALRFGSAPQAWHRAESNVSGHCQ